MSYYNPPYQNYQSQDQLSRFRNYPNQGQQDNYNNQNYNYGGSVQPKNYYQENQQRSNQSFSQNGYQNLSSLGMNHTTQDYKRYQKSQIRTDPYKQSHAIRRDDHKFNEQRYNPPLESRPTIPTFPRGNPYQNNNQGNPYQNNNQGNLYQNQNNGMGFHKRNSNFIYLSNRDFTIGQGSKGSVLRAVDLKGFFLVNFISNKCKFCEELLETLDRIKPEIPGCNIAVLNFSEGANMEVARKTMRTILPIKSTPVIIMYIDGKPFLRYDGSRTAQGIIRFVADVFELFAQQRNSRANNQNDSDSQITENEKESPYQFIEGVGIAVDKICESKGSCYFTFNQLYGEDKEENNDGPCKNGECCFLTYSQLYEGNGNSSEQTGNGK